MHYIILDMEWDSAFFAPEKKFINQIIQIGAVKLNDAFEVVDTFEETVRSGISNRVSGRFSKLTGITNDMMRSGIPLRDAVEKYNSWAGDGSIVMTWSNSDLFSILENEKYLLNGIKFKIEKYLDLQQYVQSEMRLMGYEINSQISLSRAAEMLEVTTDSFSLHTARDDSLVCAALLKKCCNRERLKTFVKDTSDGEFYGRLCFKPFYIEDIKDQRIDKSAFKFCCEKCGARAKRKSKWVFKNRYFKADFICNKCGNVFSASVSFKKTYDSVKVKRRIYPVNSDPVGKGGSINEMQSVSSQM